MAGRTLSLVVSLRIPVMGYQFLATRVTEEGVQPGQTVTGILDLAVKATVPGGGNVDRLELFVDGRRNRTVKLGERLALDPSKLVDGRHVLRIVAIEAGLIQSQGRRIIPVNVGNRAGRKTM